MHILLSYAKKLKDEVCLDEMVKELKKKMKSNEPFVGMSIDVNLPHPIKSTWIFVVRKKTIPHYHPNSIQHSVVIEGKGKVKIGDAVYHLFPISQSIEKSWCVIEKNVIHEFFPDKEMILLSFHTCPADELIELKETGEKRKYIKNAFYEGRK